MTGYAELMFFSSCFSDVTCRSWQQRTDSTGKSSGNVELWLIRSASDTSGVGSELLSSDNRRDLWSPVQFTGDLSHSNMVCGGGEFGNTEIER